MSSLRCTVHPGATKLDQMIAAAAVVGSADGSSFAWTQPPQHPKPVPFAATATASAPMLAPMRHQSMPIGGHAADTRAAGAQLMSLVHIPARTCIHPARMQSHPAFAHA